MTTPEPASSESLPAAFLPLHKRAFGTATGTAAAIVVFLVTAVYLVRGSPPDLHLGLLSQYFAGYTETWSGALVGAAWAGFVGFVMGWFVAFARNMLLAIMLVVVRTRAELSQTRDFLDHI
jgi:hypothetical protein